MPASCGPSRPFGIDAVLNRALLSINFTAGQPAEAVLGLPGAGTGRRGTEISHPVDMLYKITVEPDYLNAELFNRETMDETREFLQVVANAAVKHQRSRVLISVHASNPVFTVERSGFLAYFKKLTADPSHKIALLGDSVELGISHQYIEFIGRQHGVRVQSFQDEAEALQWFNAETLVK